MRVKAKANPFIPEVHLFHDRAKYRRFVEKKVGECEISDAEGQTVYVDGIAAILITSNASWHNEAALLTHEAVHAVMSHLGWLGDEAPSEEVLAYAVQIVSGALFHAHEDWKVRHGFI